MIVIHIGLKKCGSSSIQTFLSQNYRELKNLSLYYPRMGRLPDKMAHHNLAYELQGATKFDPQTGTLRKCASHWTTLGHPTLILSSEMFEEVESRQARILRDRFLKIRPSEEFRVYLVIRDLVDLMPSSYAQKVRYGFNDFDFDSFFRERMSARRVQYCRTAHRWAKAFGRESMHVRVLDPAHLAGADLIADFLQVCGISEQPSDLPLTRTGVRNTAPGWRVLEATRALYNGLHGLDPRHSLVASMKKSKKDRTFGRRLGKHAADAGGDLGWNADRGRYLTRDQAQLCYETYRDTVRRLKKKVTPKLPLPPDLDERGFCERPFLPDVSHISRRDLDAFYDRLWERIAAAA